MSRHIFFWPHRPLRMQKRTLVFNDVKKSLSGFPHGCEVILDQFSNNSVLNFFCFNYFFWVTIFL